MEEVMTDQEEAEVGIIDQEDAMAEATPDAAAEAAAPDAAPAPSEESSDAAASPEDAAQNEDPFLSGSWNGHPRYECPYCPHAVVAERGGTTQILQHIGQRHTRVQVSSVLGPDGKPVIHLEKR